MSLKHVTRFGLLALTTGLQGVQAQEIGTPGHGGIQAGGFTLLPSLEVSGVHDDNIFRRNSQKVGDFLTQIRPRFEARSNWSRHAMDFFVSSDIAVYSERSTEDYQDVITQVGGRLDVLRDSFATVKFGFDKLHEIRGNPEDRFGRSPTDYRRFWGTLGYTHKFNRLSAGIEHTTQYVDYDNVPTIFGFTIDNQDRDRYRNTTSLRFGYEIQPGYEAFIRGSYHTVDYDRNIDRGGFQRSSEGYGVDAGMAFDLTGLIVGDIFLGYRSQSYDDSRLQSIDSMAGGINLVWQPTRLTTVNANVQTGIKETILPGVSGFFSSSFDLQVEHELRRNIIIAIRGGYTRNDYQGRQTAINQVAFPQREENVFRGGASVSYLLNRYLYLKGSYDYADRDVNITGDDFTVNRFMLTLGGRI